MFQAAALLTAILFGQMDGAYVLSSTLAQDAAALSEIEPDYSRNSDVELYLEENFATHYFANLTENFGNNTKNSCGFVAAEMLLTFYDTYWDDDIVDDSYITKTVTTGPDAEDFIGIESPGGTPDPAYTGSSDISYYQEFVETHADESLNFRLLSIASDLYSTLPSSDSQYAATIPQVRNVVSEYLRNVRGFSKSDFTTTYINYSTEKTLEWVKDKVEDGIPVFLGVKFETSNHFVIVYDYDEAEDDLYVHYGWQHETKTCREHLSYNGMGVIETFGAFTLTFNTDHNHSGNYQFVDENGDIRDYCICYSVVPWSISVDNYYLDQLPTYCWTALKGEWYEKLTYRVAFLNTSGYEKLVIEGVFGFSLDLTSDEFTTVLDISGSSYRVYISLELDGEDFLDDLYCVKTFSDPVYYESMIQVLPSDWGFEARYWFRSEGIRYTTLELDDLTIETERLRCGYIEEKYVVLSAKREDAGEAYLELQFDRKVYYLVYSAQWWSSKEDALSASLSVQDSSGTWTQAVDFISESLPKGGVYPQRELFYFEDGITGLRFEVGATATGDRNKGRLCIDDLVFGIEKTAPEFFYGDYRSTYLDR